MKCIYCSNKTQVTNSRVRALNPSVWRRRECLKCVAQFTTNELPDYESSIAVSDSNQGIDPFSRDKLFISLYKALGHRDDSLRTATEIVNTVIGKLLRHRKAKEGYIPTTDIATVAYETLKRFDPMAASTYKAYHKDSLKISR